MQLIQTSRLIQDACTSAAHKLSFRDSNRRLHGLTGPGIELTYHRTTFRVATINGVSGWSTFQNSPVLPVAN